MRTLSTICFLSIATCSVAGCELHPRILSAHSYKNNDNERIEITISRSDAIGIKNRQIYFSLVVVSCGDGKNRFPMDAYIEEERASEFKFSTAADNIKISGSMPASIYEKYDYPCAALEGGGYFTGTLKSERAQIIAISP